MTPTRKHAYRRKTCSFENGSVAATTSPLRSPRARSLAAKASMARSKPAQLTRAPVSCSMSASVGAAPLVQRNIAAQARLQASRLPRTRGAQLGIHRVPPQVVTGGRSRWSGFGATPHVNYARIRARHDRERRSTASGIRETTPPAVAANVRSDLHRRSCPPRPQSRSAASVIADQTCHGPSHGFVTVMLQSVGPGRFPISYHRVTLHPPRRRSRVSHRLRHASRLRPLDAPSSAALAWQRAIPAGGRPSRCHVD